MLRDYITAQFQMPRVRVKTLEPPGFFDGPTNILLVAILMVMVVGVGVLIYKSKKSE